MPTTPFVFGDVLMLVICGLYDAIEQIPVEIFDAVFFSFVIISQTALVSSNDALLILLVASYLVASSNSIILFFWSATACQFASANLDALTLSNITAPSKMELL